MKTIFLLVTATFYGSGLTTLFGQTRYATADTAYIQAVEQALGHLEKGQCQPCLDAYQKAFKIAQKSALSTMRAALCAYQCQQPALAKTYIQQAVDIDYPIAEDTWIDYQSAPEFNPFRASSLKDLVQDIFVKKDAQLGINQSLKAQLQAIYTTDQQPRSRIDSLIRVYGQNSPQMQQLWQSIHREDSINLIKIEQIIQQYGYPGRRLVGAKLANTAWLIIQHSPVAIQEKYFSLIEQAANQGEMSKTNMALLIDRIRVYKGQKQLYGTQVNIDSSGQKSFDPIEDEKNVNKRRAEVGLGSLEEYAKQFGFEYKPTGN
ncbi:DUF6624 domain-containing protein [Spirosoma utsteinense]|uniref:Uncharacterized protein n=1 Tax=Spirosoma utsteinense TaxID=2585773 RepID=A0ABR6W889_9BACT|nr:DUF6624 domain-containing protein [Spirosoma utsteinense]MBC3787903.1 hypothetical protein [Spirosoma utsteinense]MBC3792176.1 hypothetical protein [Spirosoma utsteinense]